MDKLKENSKTLLNNSNDFAINIVSFISFCSPIIIPTSLFLLTIYTNDIPKGLLYISLILGILFVRIVFLLFSNINIKSTDNNCNTYNIFSGNNTTLSTYIISFTFFYLSFPMFVNNSINIGIITFLIFYLIFDIITKYTLKCFKDIEFLKFVFADFVSGSMWGVLISCLMYYFGGQNLLFLTSIPSNKVTCSKPSQQTFKCAVYKNGQLVTSQNVV